MDVLLFEPGIVTIPSILMLVLFPLCPESPHYLYLNQHHKAKAMEGSP